jgi:hypothetical protein
MLLSLMYSTQGSDALCGTICGVVAAKRGMGCASAIWSGASLGFVLPNCGAKEAVMIPDTCGELVSWGWPLMVGLLCGMISGTVQHWHWVVRALLNLMMSALVYNLSDTALVRTATNTCKSSAAQKTPLESVGTKKAAPDHDEASFLLHLTPTLTLLLLTASDTICLLSYFSLCH